MDFDTDEDSGGRLWEDPADWLSGGRGGVEFTFDFGLSLRAGLSSFTTWESVTAGAGLVVAKFLRIDYAFESHPVLSPVHRVSVSISPYLFSHSERDVPLQSQTASTSAPPLLLQEEPENSSMAADEANRETAPAESSATVDEESAAPAASDEEVLEPAGNTPEPEPAGGVFWEE